MRYFAPWTALFVLMISPSNQSSVEASSLIGPWSELFTTWYQAVVTPETTSAPKKKSKKKKKKKAAAVIVESAAQIDSDDSDDEVATTVAPEEPSLVLFTEEDISEDTEGFSPVLRKGSKPKLPKRVYEVKRSPPSVVQSSPGTVAPRPIHQVSSVKDTDGDRSSVAPVISEVDRSSVAPVVSEGDHFSVAPVVVHSSTPLPEEEIRFRFGDFEEEVVVSGDQFADQDGKVVDDDESDDIKDVAIDEESVVDDIDDDDHAEVHDYEEPVYDQSVDDDLPLRWVSSDQAFTLASSNVVYLRDPTMTSYKIVSHDWAEYVAALPVHLIPMADITLLLGRTDLPRTIYRASTDGINARFELKVSHSPYLAHEAAVLRTIESLGIAPRVYYIGGLASPEGEQRNEMIQNKEELTVTDQTMSVLEKKSVLFPPIHSVTEAVGATLAEYSAHSYASDLVSRIAQVISSLHQLHASGFVHGSISEYTLRLTLDSSLVLLTDFEFSKFYPRFTCPQHKQADQIYWSPNELQGGHYLPQDDTFRAIETLYRLLGGVYNDQQNLVAFKATQPLFKNIWFPKHALGAKPRIVKALNNALNLARHSPANYKGIFDALTSASRMMRKYNL